MPNCAARGTYRKLPKWLPFETRMPFSRRPTSHLLIESQTQFDLGLVWPLPHLWPWPQTSQTKLNWCPGSKINIFHTRLPWPWPNDLDTQTWPRYVKMYHHTKNQVYMSTISKVTAWTDTHTDTMKTLPLLHMQEVNIGQSDPICGS